MSLTHGLSRFVCVFFAAGLSIMAGGEARGQSAKAPPQVALALESVRLGPLFPSTSDMLTFGKLKWRRLKKNLGTDVVAKESRAVSSGMYYVSYIKLGDRLEEMKKQVKYYRGSLQRFPEEHEAKLESARGDLANAESYARQKAHNKSLQNRNIRHAIREFIRQQLQALRELSLQRGLMDTVGSEIITRKQSDRESRLIADFQHPVPSQATLIGIGFNAGGEARLSPCLLRPSGEQLTIIWRGKELHAEKAGNYHFLFEVPVIARKDDLIGITSPAGLNITYDPGVGDGRILDIVAAPGESLTARDFQDKGKRAYSFNMYGIIE